MGKYIPVDPEKWAAMVQAQAENKRIKEQLNSVTETHRINTSMWKDDLVRYKEICDELDAECSRLKAEVERLTAVFVPENLILRADVNRLKNNCDYLDCKLDEELDKSAMLCGQVERLTKAGDELHAFLINYIVESRISSAYLNKLDDGWHAAKEGKQP